MANLERSLAGVPSERTASLLSNAASKGFPLAVVAHAMEILSPKEEYAAVLAALTPLVEDHFALAEIARAQMYQFGSGEDGGIPNYDRAIELYKLALSHIPKEPTEYYKHQEGSLGACVCACLFQTYKQSLTFVEAGQEHTTDVVDEVRVEDKMVKPGFGPK